VYYSSFLSSKLFLEIKNLFVHENYIERIFKCITVHFWELETWKVFKECRQDGVGICLARLYSLVTTICAKTFIICITHYRNLQVFQQPMYLGLLFFTDIACHKTVLASYPVPFFSFIFRHFLATQVSRQMSWTVSSIPYLQVWC